MGDQQNKSKFAGLSLFKKSLGYPESVSTALPPQALGIARSPFHPGSALHTIEGNVHLHHRERSE